MHRNRNFLTRLGMTHDDMPSSPEGTLETQDSQLSDDFSRLFGMKFCHALVLEVFVRPYIVALKLADLKMYSQNRVYSIVYPSKCGNQVDKLRKIGLGPLPGGRLGRVDGVLQDASIDFGEFVPETECR